MTKSANRIWFTDFFLFLSDKKQEKVVFGCGFFVLLQPLWVLLLLLKSGRCWYRSASV